MLSPFSPLWVMPITSMKNLALSANLAVKISTWPRWAMSRMGSGGMGPFLSIAVITSILPNRAREHQDQIVGRHGRDLGRRQAGFLRERVQIGQVAHAPVRILRP